MDEKNNKLEEFFNQSLNQFDDSPSDAVWEGLQQRLDSERTFIEVWTAAIRKYFPYLLLLLMLGGYHFFAQNKINKLSKNLATIQSENLLLDTKLQDCSSRETELLTDLKIQSDELLNSSTKIAVLTENYEAQLNKKGKTHQHTFNRPIQNNLEPSIFRENDPEHNEYITELLKSKLAARTEVIKRNKGTAEAKNKIDPSDKIKSSTIAPTLLPILAKRPALLNPPIGRYFSNGIKRGIRIQGQEESEKSKFRIGYNYRVYHTLTGTGKHFNYGDTHGLRMELIFRNKLALTGGINFNDQHYKVSNAGNAIPISDLLKYPGGSGFGNQVTEVKAKGHYLGFPLGLKWQLKNFKNQSNVFINPAFVWQIYFPQEFEYTLNDNSDFTRKTRQIFGYFGSGNIQVGYEKLIKNNLVWQLSVWGEKSFAPLGIEDQSITMLGLSTAVLFQK